MSKFDKKNCCCDKSDEKSVNSELRIAIAGNPNSGKTSFFNTVAKRSNRVGNWPGVTVEKIEGSVKFKGRNLRFIDLPGTYSLSPDTEEQKIAEDFIKNGEYDLIFSIVDASNLARNLLLTLQMIEKGKNVVVFLNMIDIAKKNGQIIDVQRLSDALGVEVFPLVAVNKKSAFSALEAALLSTEKKKVREAGIDIKGIRSVEDAYKIIDSLCNSVVKKSKRESMTDKIDRVVLNKFAAIPIFLLSMYAVFWFAINVGSVFIDFFDIVFGAIFVDWFGALLLRIGSPEWLKVILADGIGAGIQTVATFIPVVYFMFLMMSILEDSGYMSRAAFLADKVMKRIGLPGTSFVPLIVGFGCTVPAIMGTRVLSSRSDKLKTIFMAPFMSCGARLPVYALFCAAFFGKFSGLVVFSIYLVGVFAAILTGLLLKKTLFKGKGSDFFIELPQYHFPRAKNIFKFSGIRLKFFLKKATSVVVIAVAILGVMNSIGVSDGKVSFGNEDSQGSLLTVMGKGIAPVMKPAGIEEENWPAAVALFTGLFAKEAIVGTINSLYGQLDSEDGAATNVAMANDIAEMETPIEVADIGFPIEAIGEGFVSIWENFVGIFTSADLLGAGMVAEGQDVVAEELETGTAVFYHLQRNFTGVQAYAYLLFVLLYFPCLAVVGATRKEAGWFLTVLMIFYTTTLAWVVSVLFYQIAEGHNFLYMGIALILAAVIYGVFKVSALVIGRQEVAKQHIIEETK